MFFQRVFELFERKKKSLIGQYTRRSVGDKLFTTLQAMHMLLITAPWLLLRMIHRVNPSMFPRFINVEHAFGFSIELRLANVDIIPQWSIIL